MHIVTPLKNLRFDAQIQYHPSKAKFPWECFGKMDRKKAGSALA